MKIPVVWHEGANAPDNRQWLGVTNLLNQAFDTAVGYEFTHHSTWAELPSGAEGAVIVYHGDHEYKDIVKIQEELKTLKWALIIVIGDESSLFPAGRLMAMNRRIWFQMPIPGARHSYCSHFLLCGYPADVPQHLEGHDVKAVDRPNAWYFAGQVTHRRRREAAQQLRRLKGGRLVETAGFWQGEPRPEYYAQMAKAKIIPCPAGTVTPDSFRVAEALEAGALPIVDGHCSVPGYPEGFWKHVLGEDPPFPIIDDWKDLPNVMARALMEWPANRDRAVAWWKEYKTRTARWLVEDLNYLRGVR